MAVAYATRYLLVCWLIVAIPYWIPSHHVQTHTNLVCFFDLTKHNHTPMTLYDWNNGIKDVCKISKLELNKMHLFLKIRSTKILTKNTSRKRWGYLSITHHFSSKNKYHLGPPIKWWGGICLKRQRSNTPESDTKCYRNAFAHIRSKKPTIYDSICRTKTMAAASSTRNKDDCVVEENEVINNSQKRTPSAIVTATQKKTKSKKNLRTKYSSLWLGFQALNLINKQKELPMESGESTRELMKMKIDFDEAEEM